MRYLYAIQDAAGREVCSAAVEPKNATDVAAHYDPTTETVRLLHNGEEIARGQTTTSGEQLAFLRWKADDKLGHGVKHAVHAEA